ncbi:hypothetical protein [Peribacillus asahii]|uniref:hypothetical protein n=1 Tax=Peribacillus asahii TaxID=228899 RepID=UPI0038128EAF
MILFSLNLKEQNKKLENIISRGLEGEEAIMLFTKIKEEFVEYLVEEKKDSEPFLYMKLVPVKEEENQIASIIPTTFFKAEIREQLIDFINKN